MTASIERQLLFAILAFQNNFIDRKTLLAAFDDWSQDKTQSIGAILLGQKALSREKLALVEALVVHHLQQDAGDAGKSLGHVAARNPALSDELKTIGDPVVQASLMASLVKHSGPPADGYATMAATIDQRPDPTTRYKILRPHARGGLGEVFVAEDGEVPREVALKQMQARHAEDADSRARFIQEAEITGGLEHPNIVPVYGLGTYADGRPYYAMRFIRGDSFEAAIDRYHAAKESEKKRARQFKLRKLLQRFIDVCNAVEYAHSRGVLHRDLKPANVMLGKFGETLVVDWGLAKIIKPEPVSNSTPTDNVAGQDTDERPISSSSSDNAAPTQMGSALGTPQFMSPEQAAGRLDLIGPASDVYSLGATLYYLLAGRSPFKDKSVGEVLRKVQAGDFPPPRQVNPSIDRALDAVCRRAMSLKSGDRYVSPRALADDLERWLADEPVRARKESPPAKIARWTRKNRTWTLAGILALVTVSVVSATAAVLIQDSKVSELRAVRVAAAADSFSRGLQAEQWTDAHLAHMERQIAELESLGYPNVDELRDRLATEYGQSIARKLQVASITEDDVQAMEARLAWLESRKPAAAQALREAFSARLRVWQPLFALQPPYAKLTEVFDPATAKAGNGGLLLAAGDAKTPFAVTRQSADGSVQLHAVFGDAWDRQRRVGLAFRAPDGHGYEFLLVPVVEGNSRGETTFAAVRRTGGNVRLEIRRNGNVLQQLEVPAAGLESGPLRIAAERVRERLTLEVDEKTRLEAYDPFPLPGKEFVFAVACPAETPLAELRAARQSEASKPSPLETADRLYDAGDYGGALAAYVAAAGRAENPEIRQEAACKQGMCLAALDRPGEAVETFQKASAETGERWPAVAAMHLWFSLEREQRTAEADEAFESLSSKYRFDQLAAIIPHDLRTRLFAAQGKQFGNLSAFSSFSPARLKKMEQIAAIDRLLSPDGRGQRDVQWNLLRGYMFSDDLQRAIPLAQRIYEEHPGSPPLRNYVRLLSWTGNPKQGVEIATQFLKSIADGAQFGNGAAAEAYLCRARAYIADKQWDKAARDIDEAIRLAEHDHNHGPAAAALRGLLLEREGMSVSAVECYRKCFLEHRKYLQTAQGDNTGAVLLLILGAWCGELTDEEAADRLLVLIGGNDGSPIFKALGASFQSESLGSSVRSMWLTPRGRRVAEETYILESASMATRIRSLIALIGTEIADRGAFNGRADDEQQQLLHSTASRFYDAVLVRNELNTPQIMQLVLSWKGTVNFLGWAGVAPGLAPEMRAEVAYILAARLLRRGAKAEAEAVLKEAVDHGADDSLAKKLAAIDLELLKRGAGRVRILPDGRSATVRIMRGGKEQKVVTTAEPLDVELPSGTYDVAIADDEGLLELSAAKFQLNPAEHAVLEVRARWSPSAGSSSLFGIVPATATLPQVGTWQCDTIQPRGFVGSLCWSPDDTRLACVTMGQVRVYDPSTLKLLRVFRGDSNGVVAWSSQGVLALTESLSEVRIVTLDGKIDRQLRSASGAVRAAAWSNDGKILATAGGDKSVRLWTADGEPLRTFSGHEGEVIGLAWSSDDKFLLSGARDGTARVWTADGASGPVINDFGPETALAWRPGTHTACTKGKPGEIRLTTAEGATLEPIRIPPGTVRRLAWTPDGTLLSVTIGGEIIQVRPDQEATSKIRASNNALTSACWSHDGKTLATACGDAGIRLWDSDGKPLSSLEHNSLIRTIALSTDGTKLGVGRVGKPMLLASDGRSASVLDAPNGMWNDFVWNPRDGDAASGGYTGKAVYIWNADGTLKSKFDAKIDVRYLSWSPDGMRLAGMGYDGKVRIWDREGQLLGSPDSPETLVRGQSRITWRPAPVSLWTPYPQMLVRWDDTLQPLPSRQILESFRDLKFCEPSPKGDQVLLGGSKGAKVVAIDADWSAELAHPKSYVTTVDCIQAVWSTDGRRAVVGTSSGRIVAFDPSNPSPPTVLEGHSRTVTGLGLTADGRFLHSSSSDGTIRKWDLDRATVEWVAVPLTGDQLAVFTPGGRPLFATEKAEEQLVYLVERPDRSWDAITPQDFRRKIETRSAAR